LVLTVVLSVNAPLLERGHPLHAQAIQNEYRLKAAFLYQFPQFVEWPAAAWERATAVQICVLRPSPFGRELESLVAGESLNGRPLTVREVTASNGVAGCHVLFVGSGAQRAAEVLRALDGQPVLTVGEGDRFLDGGGTIALRMVERRVRFEVSVANAQKAGLRISAQLLDLALHVRGGPS
jgi:hypothetical protein